MIRSCNEISAMVAKAARGAGLPLGVAEDLAAAVPAFCKDRNVTQSLSDLTEHLATQTKLLSLVAALDMVEASGEPVTLSMPLDGALTALVRQRRCISIAETRDEVTLGKTEHAELYSLPAPEAIDEGVWDRLSDYAAKTYVPATEASRIAGAGAGLTDND